MSEKAGQKNTFPLVMSIWNVLWPEYNLGSEHKLDKYVFELWTDQIDTSQFKFVMQ